MVYYKDYGIELGGHNWFMSATNQEFLTDIITQLSVTTELTESTTETDIFI